jgi:arginase family enzyme
VFPWIWGRVGAAWTWGQARRVMPGCKAGWSGWGTPFLTKATLPVPNPEEDVAQSGARRLKTVTAVCQNIYDIARKCVTAEEFAIFLGGDHSISIGSIAAASQDEPLGVIWVDAHGDFNTPQSSPSGNIHGMPVAHAHWRRAGTAD